MEIINDIVRLRGLLGEPGTLTRHKIHRRLSPQARAYIERSPLFLLATSDDSGQPCLSPKGDAPGFVHVEDERTLLVPERSGNRLLFSLENVLRNPHVALLFLCPRTDETLRIAGRATLLNDAALNARFSARGKDALLVMRVDVEECYFHCAKAFLRSGLWHPEAWPDAMKVSFAEEIRLNKPEEHSALAALDEQITARYKSDL